MLRPAVLLGHALAPQNEIAQGDLFSDVVVADYLFAKDRLFAEQTLPELELELYDRLAGALGESVPFPDPIVWLDAPTKVLLANRGGRLPEKRRSRLSMSMISAPATSDLGQLVRLSVLRLDNRDMDHRATRRSRCGKPIASKLP